MAYAAAYFLPVFILSPKKAKTQSVVKWQEEARCGCSVSGGEANVPKQLSLSSVSMASPQKGSARTPWHGNLPERELLLNSEMRPGCLL